MDQMLDYKIPHRNLKASILIYEPDVNPCILDKKFNCKKSGYEMELFEIAAKLLKLNLTFVQPPDRNFGSFVNNSWNGIVAQLLKGETEISAKMLTMTEIRSKVVDFGFPVKYTHQGFLIRNPSLNEVSNFNIAKAVKPIFWGFLAFLLLILFFFAIAEVKLTQLQSGKKKSISGTWIYMLRSVFRERQPNAKALNSPTVILRKISYQNNFSFKS